MGFKVSKNLNMGIKTTRILCWFRKRWEKWDNLTKKSYFQSSELGTPHPLTRRRVCPPLWLGGEGGQTRLRKRGNQRGDTHSPAGVRGCRVPIRTRGPTLWYFVTSTIEYRISPYCYRPPYNWHKFFSIITIHPVGFTILLSSHHTVH